MPFFLFNNDLNISYQYPAKIELSLVTAVSSGVEYVHVTVQAFKVPNYFCHFFRRPSKKR